MILFQGKPLIVGEPIPSGLPEALVRMERDLMRAFDAQTAAELQGLRIAAGFSPRPTSEALAYLSEASRKFDRSWSEAVASIFPPTPTEFLYPSRGEIQSYARPDRPWWKFWLWFKGSAER